MSQSKSLNAWNTAGVFVRPKGITSYSKCPMAVWKAVFHSSLLCTWTFLRSSLVKISTFWSGAKADVVNTRVVGDILFFLQKRTQLPPGKKKGRLTPKPAT